jgi:phenylacetate-CoA ligase
VTRFFWDVLTLREHLWHRRDLSARHAFIRSRPEAALGPTWGPPANRVFACGESANLPINHSLERKRDWLRELDPHYLISTASTIRALAQIARAGDLPLPRLREVRSIGETVTDELRQLVRAAWDVKLVDIYSSSECGQLAFQCPESQHYHTMSECVIVEVLDAAGRPCAPGEIGRIVVSPLHNFAMPLVRYDTGDFAETGESCTCGRGLPRLIRILGRRRNRLWWPDGSTSWPNLSSLPWLELAPALRRFQLRQRPDRSLLLRYEAGRELSADERERVAEALFAKLRCQLPLDFERVDALPLSPAGKLEDFVSEIDQA